MGRGQPGVALATACAYGSLEMPRVRANGVELHYDSTGSGPEAVVLSHGLLFSGEMFREQVRHLAGRYRVITYDHRGQGSSEVTRAGYDMDNLARDAAELVEAPILKPRRTSPGTGE